MPTVKLTDALIAAAEPKETIYALNDLETPGLQCVINPKGKKTFWLKTRSVAKKIGIFPIVKYAEARKTSLIWYGDLIQGKTPEKKTKTEEVKKITVDQIVREYLAFKKSELAEITFRKYQWIWKKVISPALGNKDLTEINDPLVNKFFFSLQETYSNAEFSLMILKPAFRHAKKLGYAIPSLDYSEWHRYKGNKRERYLTPGELTNFWKTLAEVEEKAQDQYGMGVSMSQILKLLLLTGCRRGEILNLKWSDVYVNEGYIQLWKTKTKKGRIVPIVQPILEIIEKLPRLVSSPFVFPALRNNQKSLNINTFYTFWVKVTGKAKFNENNEIEPIVIHSLRHTYITVAHRSGVSPWIIQALVGHINKSSITGDYIHLNLNDLKLAATIICNQLMNNGTNTHNAILR